MPPGSIPRPTLVSHGNGQASPLLDEAGFDAFVEEQCAKFYADGVGRPSLAPGRYFRMRFWATSKVSIRSSRPGQFRGTPWRRRLAMRD